MKRILILIILCVITAGCSAGNEATVGKPATYKETVGELAYEINLNKNSYDRNDEIVVNTRITNLGEESINYVSGSSSCPNRAIVKISNVKTNAELAIKPYGPCTDDLGTSQLKPGQTVEDTHIFVAKVYEESGLKTARPGKYDIEVKLPEDLDMTGNNHSASIKCLSVKTQTTLVK
ncbi:hypothetical protein M3194_02100 [Paenibacillus glycanilyticus]|uniref:hypothetical protein n=1 Tax=Paenibacillus glycanilyticus TaxID=126569 RepID=UPI00203FD5DB|nr:hypothetical protein [Paenibacillus glycanilyticus]MCM3626158.1 hypothetical protein [Paenibacillus glycanilyticus]